MNRCHWGTASVGDHEGAPRLEAFRRRGRVWTMVLMVGLAALMAVAGIVTTAWAQEELFVANRGGNSITVYTRTADGNAAPLRTLKVSDTGGVAVDPVNNELVVANFNSSSITIYARTASGNTAPIRTLGGTGYGSSIPIAMAVDTVNNELVVDNVSNSITVYPRTASGNVGPLRTLSGPATGLDEPRDVAIDTVNNELAVLNFGNRSITIYPRTASGNILRSAPSVDRLRDC